MNIIVIIVRASMSGKWQKLKRFDKLGIENEVDLVRV